MPALALPAVAVDTTLCVEWKEVKALSPLSAARPLPRLVCQASFDSQDFLQVPWYLTAGHPFWGFRVCGAPLPPSLLATWTQQLAAAWGCSDVSHEPGCILGEISPWCLVAMAMQFVARLQILHCFPRGHGLRAWHGWDRQRGQAAGLGCSGMAVALHEHVCVFVHKLGRTLSGPN